MNWITLNVDLLAGTHILAAAFEMEALARKLGVTVRASFNGIAITVKPGDAPAAIQEHYDRAQEGGFTFATASYPPPGLKLPPKFPPKGM